MIEQLIPQLLFDAAAAMKAMQGKKKAEKSGAEALEANRAEFTKPATHYFESIQDIFTRLRTEIGHIERAQKAANPSSSGATGGGAGEAAGTSTSAAKDDDGLGSLDPGWLNSRLNGGEASFEAGLWRQAEKLVAYALAVKKGEQVDELPKYLQEGSDDENHEQESSKSNSGSKKSVNS